MSSPCVNFRIAPHTVREGDAVEVWDGDEMIAAIYSIHRGIRILSKYAKAVREVDPVVAEVRFGRQEV